jgi:chromosome segregation ATPase
MKELETGVDKLVQLVAKFKKISVDKAAKELGVSSIVVQEWADFLEEQGLISIEYTLSNVYLVEKKLTKKEVFSKAKEFTSKKESFVRRVETAISTFERDFDGFEKIRHEFESLKKDMGSEMTRIEQELGELHKYEQIKSKIDDDVKMQKEEYLKLINGAHQQIETEEKKFKQILSTLAEEREKIKQERDEIHTLEENEEKLKEKIKAFTSIVETIKQKVSDEKLILDNSEKRIIDMGKLIDEVEVNIKEKKENKIAPLIKLSLEQEKKIDFIQADILRKVELAKKNIEKQTVSGKEAAAKFKKFFEKKAEIEKLFEKIESERNKLKTEMEDLVKAAMSFNILDKGGSLKDHIADLESKFGQLEQRKGLFKKEIEKLTDMIKGY